MGVSISRSSNQQRTWKAASPPYNCLGTHPPTRLHAFLARDIWNHCEYRDRGAHTQLTHTERRTQQQLPGHGTYGEQPISEHSDERNNTLDTVVLKTPQCRLRHPFDYPLDPC
jgi:hypothetical protein